MIYCVAHATIVKFTTRDMWLHENDIKNFNATTFGCDHNLILTYVILFLCNTKYSPRMLMIPTVILWLIIGNTSHDHFNASIYVTLILESISYLNFRLSIQTKIQL